MDIKVGEYIRTKDGEILKIDSFEKDCKNIDCVCFTTGEIYTQELLNEIIVKHSKNIIDLVEVRDIVNGCLIDEITTWGTLVHKAHGIDRSGFSIPVAQYNEDIKTILTHEQYNANCYKVKGE